MTRICVNIMDTDTNGLTCTYDYFGGRTYWLRLLRRWPVKYPALTKPDIWPVTVK